MTFAVEWTLILRTRCGGQSVRSVLMAKPPEFYTVPLAPKSSGFAEDDSMAPLETRVFRIREYHRRDERGGIAWMDEVQR